jgi:hypothetical protein
MALFQPDPQVLEGKVARLQKQLTAEKAKTATLEAHVRRLDEDIEQLWWVVFRGHAATVLERWVVFRGHAATVLERAKPGEVLDKK